MEDILASIRRILSEDDAKPASGDPSTTNPHDAADDILILDASMLVAEPAAPAVAPVLASAQPPAPVPTPLPPAPPYFGPAPIVAPIAASVAAPVATQVAAPIDPIVATGASPPISPPAEGLVAPEAEAATAAAVGALLRHLRVERETATHRSGPTIEDIVRDEMRPLLKQWLDAHMPAIVERLVRAEIERVVARSVS